MRVNEMRNKTLIKVGDGIGLPKHIILIKSDENNRYIQLQKSFWKRLKFLFTGV